MLREGSLVDKVALVTGAAGALGGAVREALERSGATVVGAAAITTTVERHGHLDILVLNAGVQHMAPIGEFPTAQWQRLLDVMLSGPFYAIREAWPYLTAKPGGRIVATASTSSFVAERFKAAYVAAKHGLVGLVKVAAREGGELARTELDWWVPRARRALETWSPP